MKGDFALLGPSKCCTLLYLLVYLLYYGFQAELTVFGLNTRFPFLRIFSNFSLRTAKRTALQPSEEALAYTKTVRVGKKCLSHFIIKAVFYGVENQENAVFLKHLGHF